MNSSVAQKLKEAQEKRTAAAQDMKNRAIEKARYIQILEAKGIADREAARLRKLDEAEEALRLEEERKMIEMEEKTHKYYDINIYNRKKAVPGMPMYFGETEYVFPDDKNSAWKPRGIGEMHYDGSIQYEGTFKNGDLYGEGRYAFADDSKYSGEFNKGNMHGKGVLVTTKDRANVLMRNNIVICRREGKKLEMNFCTFTLHRA